MREVARDGGHRVYCLEATRGAYAYFVDGREAVLVDTSFPGHGPAIAKELGGMLRRLRDIVVTHYDIDHIGSLDWLCRETGARAWVPAVDAPYIRGEKPRPGIKRLIAAVIRPDVPRDLHLLEPGDQVGPLTAVAAPGHTPGHMAFRGLGCLFVGDAFATRHGAPAPSPRFMAADHPRALETMAALLAGYQGWILPAHGEPIRLD
jgi:glyoxylase-like metal-dependent hydrolase (beta-lactamase superfamily II)